MSNKQALTNNSVRPRAIAFIDDERIAADMYGRAITDSCGVTVNRFRSPGSFVSAVRTGQTFDLIITDMMMPIDEVFHDMIGDEGGDGIYAGLLVINLVRAAGVTTPIIVLTNLWGTHHEPLMRAQREYEGIELRTKHDTVPSFLAEIVREKLFSEPEPTGLEKSWSRLYKALQLKVTFAGMGIDFKELFTTKKL